MTTLLHQQATPESQTSVYSVPAGGYVRVDDSPGWRSLAWEQDNPDLSPSGPFARASALADGPGTWTISHARGPVANLAEARSLWTPKTTIVRFDATSMSVSWERSPGANAELQIGASDLSLLRTLALETATPQVRQVLVSRTDLLEIDS